eukprot:COSAG05_NODE_16746_length_339_cov_1.591667_1_plen_95_part_10
MHLTPSGPAMLDSPGDAHDKPDGTNTVPLTSTGKVPQNTSTGTVPLKLTSTGADTNVEGLSWGANLLFQNPKPTNESRVPYTYPMIDAVRQKPTV